MEVKAGRIDDRKVTEQEVFAKICFSKSVILSEGEVLRTAASFMRSITALRRSEPQSKDLGCINIGRGCRRKCRGEGTVEWLCRKRVKSVAIMSGKCDEVLRLRSGRHLREGTIVCLAPLRMTEFKNMTSHLDPATLFR
jgi:hypothetical protein